MKRRSAVRCLLVLFSFFTILANASAAAEKACIVEATIDGIIGPATLDLIERSQDKAKINSCHAILLLINTPGGNLQTTRQIVENILNSPIPFLCFVSPSGGHAGSAGAIILQSCHLAGAATATNIGAATPISGNGENIPTDLRKKILNDTRSWVEGLAQLRGRSLTFAHAIIDEAKAFSASEALKLGAIEFVGESKADFLKFAEGKKIKLSANAETLPLIIGDELTFPHDLRYRSMEILMNPEVAYTMFMGSLALLYFEVTHPGLIAPGVIGGLGLIISAMSLQMLDVKWGSLLLILVGIAFMLAEAFVASHGLLGIGGIVALFFGSLFLFDPERGYSLPLSTILPTTILLGALMIGIAYLAFSTRKKRKGALHDLLGRQARVTEAKENKGFVEINGETWKYASADLLKVGDLVKVKKYQGLTLEVEKI